MSKKMFKRSLALGALMAFVITGNVSAENWVTENIPIENSNGIKYVASNNNTEGIVEPGAYAGEALIFAGKCADSNNTGTKGKVTIGQGVTIKSSMIGIVTGCINGNYTEAVNVAVSGNEVIVNGGSLEVSYIYGGYNYSEETNNTTNNVVQINGGEIKASSSITNLKGTCVIGGYKYKNGEVKDNSVIITGGEISGDVYGGYHNNEGSAIKNSVVISGGTVTGGEEGIYGGYAKKGAADENVVTITGGEVIGNVYGGKVGMKTTSVKNNVVNVSGTAIVKEANLYGGIGTTDGTGNTLNIGWDGLQNIVSAWEGTIGSAQKFNAINMFEGSKVTFGNPLNDAKVAVNVNGATWNVDKTNTIGSASFDKDSVLVLKGDGAQFTKEGEYALNGKGTLSVEQGAKLTVEGIAQNTYNVATGFETISENKWQVTDLNTLMEGKWLKDENKNLQLQVTAKKAEDLAEDMGVSVNIANTMTEIINIANENKGDIKEGTPQADVVKFAEALADIAPEVAGQAVEAVVKMAEAGGNSATAASIVKNVTGVTNDRLSFNCGHSAPHKGGHGVGLFEEGSGADVWVEYVHGKDEVENMKSTAGATSYEGSYDGIVMGVDFKKVGKFQSGIAFNYGEGDTNSVGTSSRTHSDYDFWGVGYYGNIHNDDSNIIFDINYAQTDSDVINYNTAAGIVEASPETTTWTAGVKVEKLYQNENVQIVPYTGLRYMSIDPNDYKTKGASYSYDMERQDIWLLPLGVSIRQEIENDNGWTVSPRVDLSYIWAFGDTDSNMGFGHALDNKVTNIGYDVMDDGSFLGLVGIEAHKGQWGYGIAYSYQKGDHSESKKWYVDVNYSF